MLNVPLSLRVVRYKRALAVAAAAPVPLPRILAPRKSPLDQRDWEESAILIDKPQGWTSFDVCAKLRSAIGIRKLKVGHAGESTLAADF